MAALHLVVCDVHYEGMYIGGVDTARAWTWLTGLVESVRPSYLISCGDLGKRVRAGDLEALARRTVFLTIYGNHDVLSELRRARNALEPWRGAPVLMEEAKPYSLDGLLVAGVHGAVMRRRGPLWAPPPRRPEDFERAGERLLEALQGRRLDLLVLHETPYYPEVVRGITETPGSLAARRLVEMIRPRIVVGGHAHLEPAMGWASDTLVVHLDSSQVRRAYLTLKAVEGWVEVALHYGGETRVERVAAPP